VSVAEVAAVRSGAVHHTAAAVAVNDTRSNAGRGSDHGSEKK